MGKDNSEKIAIVYEQYPVEPQQRDKYLPQCRLKWRQGQLLVSLEEHNKLPYLSAFESEQRLVDCLKHSPVHLVCLDPSLGEEGVKRWVEVCEQASKPVFLRGGVIQKLPRNQNRLAWQLKQLINQITALLLLTVLSPIMLAIAAVIRVYSPGTIFSRQWHVGLRGKLFRIIKFRITKLNDDSCFTPLGRWMCKFGLDKLPQLFNVLRGEMSLVGSHPWTLSEAMRFISEGQRCLNALQGSVEIQPVGIKTKQLNLAG
jgi:hypothetical protein